MISFLRFTFLFLVCNVAFKGLAQPIANLTATPLSGCAPLLVNFTDASTGGPSTWNWNFGNGSNSVLQNPSTTYTASGTYTVTLTVTNSSGSNTKTITNYINVTPAPTVAFTGNVTAGCPALTVNFNNTTNLATPGSGLWNWSFGDGTSDTAKNPTHVFSTPGFYNITLIATNSGGCLKSLTKPTYIQVYAPPVGDFTAPQQTFCTPPALVTFAPTATGNGPFSYNWTYGDGNSGTTNNHTYNTPGSFTVKLIVTDANGCKDTITKPAFINIATVTAAFTSPAAGCVFAPITFTNTSTGGGSGMWDFGDGATANGLNATHIYSAPGTYTVKLKMTNGNCQDSVTHNILIHPQPNAGFTSAPAMPCPAPQLITFTNTTSGGSTYTWSYGDGMSGAGANPTHTYTTNQNFIATLIATSAFGCKDTVMDTVKLIPNYLQAGAIPFSGCAPLEVHFKRSLFTTPTSGVIYPYNIATHNWNFGDGTSSNLDTPTHIYTMPGTYTVILNVTTINGCTAADTIQILVGSKPNPSFIANPTTVCPNNPVAFTNTSTNALTYIWLFGDGGTTSFANPTYYYQITGTYNVTLIAMNNGCDSTFTGPVPITVLPSTSRMGVIKYSCDTPLLVRFTDSSIGATFVKWFFGDGTNSTALNPVHTYPALGTYNVTLVTNNNITGCSDTLVQPIQLVNPVASFVANDTAVCKNDTVQLQATYTGGIAIDYDWLVGPQYYLDSGDHITRAFPIPGQYDVTVWITDVNGCRDSLKKTNYLLVAKPTAAFTASPLLGCVPLLVNFTDQTTDISPAVITNRAWSFGNGAANTVTSPTTSYTYNTAGIFTVKLLVTDNVGCKDSLTKSNYIEARKPNAAFTANDTSACIAQTLTFSNNSTGTSISSAWDFGDGTNSTQGAPTHAYNAIGSYTVRLIVTDATGCKDTMLRNNYVQVTKPDAAFTVSDTFAICPPLHAFFTNTSLSAPTYQWSFGDGNNSSIPSPDNVYNAPGIYTVQMIATNAAGCTDTATATINVLGYAGGLTYTPLAGCAPLNVAFTANLTNVPSIVWDFSDGVTQPATGATTNHIYQTPGAYVPKLILSDGAGCLNSSQGLDTIKVDGIFGGFTVTEPCEKTDAQFQDTSFSFFSPVTNWFWRFNNGQQLSNLSNPVQNYPTPGVYPVSLVVTNANGCKDSFTRNVEIFALPVITAFGDTVICTGDAANLQSTGGIAYNWTPAASLNNPATQNPVATPVSPTNFVVTGTDVHGCKNKDSVQVDIQFKTTSMADIGGAICDDSSFQLFASGAQLYQWSPAATLNNATIPNPIASPHSTTTYLVIAKEGSCIPDSNSVTVVVYPKPEINAGADATIIAGNSITLVASGNNTQTFLWSPAATLSCDNCSNPTATPLASTDYKVIATSRYGCRDSDAVTIRVLCDESQVFIPNSFTPNGDGQNDLFYPRGQGLREIRSFRIYNRWGELIFEKRNMVLNDKAAGWDGSQSGTPLNPDTFVYVLEGTCDSGEPINWKGDITLIR